MPRKIARERTFCYEFPLIGAPCGPSRSLGDHHNKILVINPLIGVAALPFVLGFVMLIGGVGAVVQAFRMRRGASTEQPRRVR